MTVQVGGLDPEEIADTSGRPIWDETVVELCGIGLRQDRHVYVVIGDTFQTTEGCGASPTAMQDAFDAFGLPEEACVVIDGENRDEALSHCGPMLPSSPQAP
jgi:hypothetical protein